MTHVKLNIWRHELNFNIEKDDVIAKNPIHSSSETKAWTCRRKIEPGLHVKNFFLGDEIKRSKFVLVFWIYFGKAMKKQHKNEWDEMMITSSNLKERKRPRWEGSNGRGSKLTIEDAWLVCKTFLGIRHTLGIASFLGGMFMCKVDLTGILAWSFITKKILMMWEALAEWGYRN